MSREVKVAGLVLAAGESQRMGAPKQLLLTNGEPFVRRIWRVLVNSGLAPVNVVLGYRAEEVAGTASIPAGSVVLNPRYGDGMLSSLQCGVRSLMETKSEALVLALVDSPDISEPVVRALVQGFAETNAPVVEPAFQGQHGHPVLLSREVWEELLQASPGEGAKQVVRRYRPRGLQLELGDPSVLVDLDTPEDLDTWRARGAGM